MEQQQIHDHAVAYQNRIVQCLLEQYLRREVLPNGVAACFTMPLFPQI